MATALPYGSLLIFIEVPAFTRMLPDYMNDEAYTALQWALVAAFAKYAGRVAVAANVAASGSFITGANIRAKYGC